MPNTPSLRSFLVPAATIATTAALSVVVLAGAARADVIEIDAQGLPRLRTGGGAVEWMSPSPPRYPLLDGAFPDTSDGAAPGLPDAALTSVAAPVAPAAFTPALLRAAADADVSPALLEALVWQESRWQRDAVSPAGARGLAQLMPATAASLNVDPRDPEANLRGAARYLRQLLDRFDNNIELALAAYNAGPGRVTRAGGIPAISETQRYVDAITARLAHSARNP